MRVVEPELESLAETKVLWMMQCDDIVVPCSNSFSNVAGFIDASVMYDNELPRELVFESAQVGNDLLNVQFDKRLFIEGRDND
jgi:hypothetical protein